MPFFFCIQYIIIHSHDSILRSYCPKFDQVSLLTSAHFPLYLSVSVFLNLLLFILFLTVLGSPCCVWFSLVAGAGDHSLLLHGLLVMVVSLVVEHGF